jgi:hypothetical protein
VLAKSTAFVTFLDKVQFLTAEDDSYYRHPTRARSREIVVPRCDDGS